MRFSDGTEILLCGTISQVLLYKGIGSISSLQLFEMLTGMNGSASVDGTTEGEGMLLRKMVVEYLLTVNYKSQLCITAQTWCCTWSYVLTIPDVIFYF